MISTWFIHFPTLTAPTTYRAVCWSPWLQRLKYLFLTFRDLLSSVMLKVFQSKTRNWRRVVDYATILPTESSPFHNLNPQQFQREYEMAKLQDSMKFSMKVLLNRTKEESSQHRLTVVHLSVQKPCLCWLTLLIVDYKYFLSYFMALYKFRSRKVLEI